MKGTVSEGEGALRAIRTGPEGGMSPGSLKSSFSVSGDLGVIRSGSSDEGR